MPSPAPNQKSPGALRSPDDIPHTPTDSSRATSSHPDNLQLGCPETQCPMAETLSPVPNQYRQPSALPRVSTPDLSAAFQQHHATGSVCHRERYYTSTQVVEQATDHRLEATAGRSGPFAFPLVVPVNARLAPGHGRPASFRSLHR